MCVCVVMYIYIYIYIYIYGPSRQFCIHTHTHTYLHDRYLNKSQLGDPCTASLRCNGPIETVCYSPDGRRLASGSGDGFGGKVTVWDARSGAEMLSYGVSMCVCMIICISLFMYIHVCVCVCL